MQEPEKFIYKGDIGLSQIITDVKQKLIEEFLEDIGIAYNNIGEQVDGEDPLKPISILRMKWQGRLEK